MANDSLRQLSTAVQSSNWLALMRVACELEHLAVDWERRCLSNDAVQAGKCYLVTGGAGFIGSHLVRRLLQDGHRVVAIDEFNDYYDPVLKWENVADLLGQPRFVLQSMDIRDLEALRTVFVAQKFDGVIHLAARAGVRPSIVDPQLYVTVNVLGTQNLLELAREFGVRNFVYASSSSVYGGNTEFPFVETQNVDSPISPYAATKKANELQSTCYSKLYKFPVSGLRFFTVYGPSGRPDMAIRMFIEKMDRDEPIPMYGDGSFERDFTYIDDIVNGIVGVTKTAEGREDWTEVFNLGESDTTTLRELILLIAKELGKIETRTQIKSLSIDEQNQFIEKLTACGLIQRLPEQLGDVRKTYADVTKSRRVAGYEPRVKIAEGIRRTVEWHRARQRLSQSSERERICAALKLNSALRLRAGLDSLGRPKDPCYSPDDARVLVHAIGDIGALLDHSPRECFALRANRELASTLTDVAAYLGGAGDASLCRMNGLVHWRKRRAAPPGC